MSLLSLTSPHTHGTNRTGRLMLTVALATLPGLITLSRSGRKLRLQVNSAVPALRTLFELDPDLSDLGVARPTLEDAFDALTAQSRTQGA